MTWVLHNGEFLQKEDVKISPDNRAFRFADGCFEAIRIMKGSAVFWNLHMNRMFETMRWLEIIPAFDHQQVTHWAKELIRLNDLQQEGMMRILINRAGAGTYFPQEQKAEIYMETIALTYGDANDFSGKKGGFFEREKLPIAEVGNMKTVNKTMQVLAALEAQRKGIDDLILCNSAGYVAETISSNVYVLHNNQLLTPPLDSGCLNGTIRQAIMLNKHEFSLLVIERQIHPMELEQATEIWTSNARKGLEFFRTFEGRNLSSERFGEAHLLIKQMAINSSKDFREN